MQIVTDSKLQRAQLNMVLRQLRPNGILDEKILNIIKQIPREWFVPGAYRQAAYADMNIPLQHEQIMLKPFEEARLLQSLAIQPHEKILEIGTGSGYMTALFAQLADSIISVDIFPDFIISAKQKLDCLDIQNVSLQTGDAAGGWDGSESYDVIAITGSLPFLPNTFRHSLRIGGRLIAIIGQAPVMEAVLIKRIDEEQWSTQKLFETVIPALINAAQLPAFRF